MKQSRASLAGDYFLYFRNVNVYFMVILYGEIRNLSLLGVKGLASPCLTITRVFLSCETM